MTKKTPIHLGDLFLKAFAFAQVVHSDDVRKGTPIPYLSHPMQVAGLALEYGADEEQASAALLHDVIEDSATSYEDLVEAFGARVAGIVRGCSDAEDHQEKGEWKPRKAAYIRHLREEADADTLLVSCVDKLHNARSIVADLRQKGPVFFDRFTGKRDGTLWYYAALLEIFRERGLEVGLVTELEVAVQAMVALAGTVSGL
jgi:(p)ppGpp synthase/HD superfamily hydrolase